MLTYIVIYSLIQYLYNDCGVHVLLYRINITDKAYLVQILKKELFVEKKKFV